MSLVLNGVDQYARSVVGKYALREFPTTFIQKIFPTAVAAGGVMAVGNPGTNQFLELGQHNNSARMYINAADFSFGGVINLNQWNTIALVIYSRNVRELWLNGVNVVDGDGSERWHPNMDDTTTLAIGASISVVGYQPNIPCSIAKASTYARALSEAEIQSYGGTTNPKSIAGLYTYHELLADGTDANSDVDLVLVNAPTFTAAGHPDVDVFPPEGGGGDLHHPIRGASRLVGL